MPKLDNLEQPNDDVTINLKSSSVAEFVKRPLPADREVEAFDKLAAGASGQSDPDEGETINDAALDEAIDESLNEIYQDDKGRMVDVRHLDVKKRRGPLFWLLSFLVFAGSAGAAAYYGYRYLHLLPGAERREVELAVAGEREVAAGQEFFYAISYRNPGDAALGRVRLELSFPDNFVFLDSFPAPAGEDKRAWEIASVPARSSGEVKVKGLLLGGLEQNGIVFATLTYTPDNFNSEFKKEATFTTTIKDIGLDFTVDRVASALVGEEVAVDILFQPRERSFISSFRLTMEPQEGLEAKNHAGDGEADLADFEVLRPGVWQVKSVKPGRQVLPLRLVFGDRSGGERTVKLAFEKQGPDDRYFAFHAEELAFEVLQNDLNLTLIVNGKREDHGVNFGDTLNYSIVYNNKGDTDLNDVYIMAVLESDYLDWSSLNDPARGREKGNTILWSKQEVPALATIKKHQEGTIDFSIKMAAAGRPDPTGQYQVASYARYSVGGEGQGGEGGDFRSNTIVGRINSDLRLAETLRYFSEDNIPVGTGPNPPRVGQTTTYKVYWQVKNNLHELNDVTVSLLLPDYVRWDGKERATAGSVVYNQGLNAVVWELGRLPVTVFEAGAEFSISVTPGEDDRNKIMVLTPGAKARAVDTVTKETLERSSPPKTTKLDDDEIGKGDGIIE